MGTTTFSGPIKAGTIRDTTGTAVGTNVANVGQVLMAQTHLIDLTSGAISVGATNIVIPANSQIVDVVVDAVVADSVPNNLSIGDTVGGATTILNAFPVGSSAGRKYPTTQAGGAMAWSDTGTSDIKLTITTSGSTSTGSVRITVLYQQNNNLTA